MPNPIDPEQTPQLPQQPPELPASPELSPSTSPSRAQWTLVAFLIAAFSLAALFYRFIVNRSLGHTSAMFIGIPAILAIAIALAPRAKSVTGSILRGITLALLVIAPFLGEGYLCILFAAPLFYLVGIIVGLIVDHVRAGRSATLSCAAVLLLPFSLEGIVPQLTHNRAQTVEATQILAFPSSAVEAALARGPNIAAPLPHLLRIGFPRPLEAHGQGLALNDTRTIHFAGAEGDPPGDLVLRVTHSTPGHIRFTTVSDTSKLTQWLRWQTSDVTYTPIDATHTAVTWRIVFDRQLDPFWYFAPWEQLAVHQAANYLITANATP